MNARAEFVADRKKGIGGSDAAAVLGLSPWKTPLQLYLEKRGELEDTRQTVAMEWGTLIEPAIVEMYRRRAGVNVITGEATKPYVEASLVPFMRCNVDGIIVPEDHAPDEILEAKLAGNDEDWGEPGTDQVPSYYVPQAQHMLAVSGFARVKFAVLFARFGLRELQTYTVPRDQELIDMLVDQEREFWQRVVDGNPPDPTTPEEIRLRWPSDRGTSIEATIGIVATVALLAQAKLEKKRADEREEDYAAAVKNFMGDNAELTYQGRTICTWRQNRPTAQFDRDALALELPDIVAKYTGTRPGNRPLLVK